MRNGNGGYSASSGGDREAKIIIHMSRLDKGVSGVSVGEAGQGKGEDDGACLGRDNESKHSIWGRHVVVV